MSSEVPAVVTVARDLTEIGTLYESLLVQAIQKAAAKIDGTSLPGGEAMVALAAVAVPSEYAEVVEAREWRHLATCRKGDHTRCWTGSEDEDNTEPVLQTLLFWSEQWRVEHGFPLEGRRPTMTTEANVIRSLLDWAWENLAEWDDFAKDIDTAKTRLENLLQAGVRSERGVPCLYSECKGKRLVRKLVPTSKDGYKVWVLTDWHCPSCKRSWDEDRYAAMVTAANENTKYEEIEGEAWCAVEYAARQTGRSPKTIQTWINRGKVATVCLIAGKRVRFVRLEDIREQDKQAKKPRGKGRAA